MKPRENLPGRRERTTVLSMAQRRETCPLFWQHGGQWWPELFCWVVGTEDRLVWVQVWVRSEESESADGQVFNKSDYKEEEENVQEWRVMWIELRVFNVVLYWESCYWLCGLCKVLPMWGTSTFSSLAWVSLGVLCKRRAPQELGGRKAQTRKCLCPTTSLLHPERTEINTVPSWHRRNVYQFQYHKRGKEGWTWSSE